MSAKDTLYLEGLPHADFVFDEKVVSVFPDMISRSVPGYSTIIAMIGTLASEYVKPGSVCYDLGCSLGAASLSMRHQINTGQSRIIAVDNSRAMTEGCREAVVRDGEGIEVDVRCQDVMDCEINNASMVVMNFTLQFVDPLLRNALISRIHDGLLPGGLLVLSEKIRFADSSLDTLFIDMHHRFKEEQGYSKMEISRKRSALENVLVPETILEHKQRLQDAGFHSQDIWFQCFNFVSMVAVKA